MNIIMNFVRKRSTFYFSASIALLVGFVGFIVLEWSHVIYTLSMVSNLLGMNVSYTHLAMMMPENLSYEIFALEKILVPLFFIAFGISLLAGFRRIKPLLLILLCQVRKKEVKHYGKTALPLIFTSTKHKV